MAVKKQEGPAAATMLLEAAEIVSGARNVAHGHVERSFAAIAHMWSAYIAMRRDPHAPLRPHDVAHMMVLLKQQRAEWGTPIHDHWVDQAGYSAIAGELAL